MREIKFRAMTQPPKDFADYHFTSEMVYGTGIFKDPINTWICQHEDSQCLATGFISRVVKPETVGQFTGLLDKNGKEIYEGDIVKHYACGVDYIQYDKDYAGFRFVDGHEHFSCDWAYESEVLGNIHENAELLKGEA